MKSDLVNKPNSGNSITVVVLQYCLIVTMNIIKHKSGGTIVLRDSTIVLPSGTIVLPLETDNLSASSFSLISYT